MWFHTIAMIVASFITFYSAGLPVWLYVINALLAAIFIFQMLGLRESNIERSASTIFHGSITYLSLYSLALVMGALIK
jgi:heme O synthase-like polyprenyltransferase